MFNPGAYYRARAVALSPGARSYALNTASRRNSQPVGPVFFPAKILPSYTADLRPSKKSPLHSRTCVHLPRLSSTMINYYGVPTVAVRQSTTPHPQRSNVFRQLDIPRRPNTLRRLLHPALASCQARNISSPLLPRPLLVLLCSVNTRPSPPCTMIFSL